MHFKYTIRVSYFLKNNNLSTYDSFFKKNINLKFPTSHYFTLFIGVFIEICLFSIGMRHLSPLFGNIPIKFYIQTLDINIIFKTRKNRRRREKKKPFITGE